MDQIKPSGQRSRTIADRLISSLRAFYYAITEPARLRLARSRFESQCTNQRDNPLITILMPTYNRGQLLLERTLPAIFSQTYANFEVLIVGDGPTDNTRELLSSIRDPRLRYYEMPHYTKYPKETKSRWFVGGVPPRNLGLSLARGQWIAELDDDDIFLPDHLEALFRFAQDGNYELVSASYIREKHGEQEVIDARGEVPRVGGIETWFYRSYLKFFKYNIDCWRKSYNCPQEIDRQLRMHRSGVRIGFLDKVVTLVLPLPGSKTVGLDALEIRTGEKLR